MKWMGIVSIDGDLISDGAAGSQEEAKQRAETLMEKILKSRPDQHGLVHFRARKVDWSKGWISDLRLCELLTEEDFDPNRPYEDLALPLPDLVRYWWDNVADQESFVGDLLDDIFTIYKDRMLPSEPEEERSEFSDAFAGVSKAIGTRTTKAVIGVLYYRL